MNWRRGLKRLYAVCTLIWIVIAIATAANNYRSHRYWHHRSLTEELAADRKAFEEVQPVVYLDENGVPLPPQTQTKPVDIPLKGTVHEKLAAIRAANSVNLRANDAKMRARLLEPRRKKLADTERRFQASSATLDDSTLLAAFTPPQLVETAGLIAIPPLAVAVAYLVLSWIIRGFRRDDPAPPSAA